ncbi:MAG: DUF4365 domain-containing protein [Ardenticatenaceae bacterium]
MPRKKRIRQHIVADLSVNHVERFVLLAGFSVERVEHDYGIDLNLYTYDSNGEIENAFIFMQLKASDKPRYLKGGQYVSFSLDKSDLESWLEEPFPVILVLYDVTLDKAYWLYVQRYFEGLRGFDLQIIGETYAVRININDTVSVASVKQWAGFKKRILSQIEKVVNHA